MTTAALSTPPGTRPAPAFVAGLRHHGDRTAVVTGTGSLTYAELADRVDDAAVALGGGRKLVLVAASATVPALVSYLGALRGGHVVLLAPAGDPETVAGLIRDWSPDAVVGAGGIDVRAAGRHDLHEDLGLLLATSGSTGSPRLVRLARTSLDANAAAIADYLDIRPSDRAATTLPLHYCYGLSVVHANLPSGAARTVSVAGGASTWSATSGRGIGIGAGGTADGRRSCWTGGSIGSAADIGLPGVVVGRIRPRWRSRARIARSAGRNRVRSRPPRRVGTSRPAPAGRVSAMSSTRPRRGSRSPGPPGPAPSLETDRAGRPASRSPGPQRRRRAGRRDLAVRPLPT